MKVRVIRSVINIYLGGLLMLFSLFAALLLVPGTTDEENIRHISVPWTVFAFLVPVVVGFLYANRKRALKHLHSNKDTNKNEAAIELCSSRDTFLGSLFVFVSFFFSAHYALSESYNDSNKSVVVALMVILMPITVAILYAGKSTVLGFFTDAALCIYARVFRKKTVPDVFSSPDTIDDESLSPSINDVYLEQDCPLQRSDGLGNKPFSNYSSIKEYLTHRLPDVSFFFDEEVEEHNFDEEVEEHSFDNVVNRNSLKAHAEKEPIISEEERLCSEVVTFTAYTGERAGLNEANRKLVRLLFEKDIVLRSYKWGAIQIIAAHDQVFYFKVVNRANTRDKGDAIRWYWYRDYNKYYSIYPGDYDDSIKAAIKDRDEKEDLFVLSNEFKEITSLSIKTFNVEGKDHFNSFLKESESFAKVAYALSNKCHKDGSRLLEATCKSDDYRMVENEIDLFKSKWREYYLLNIEVDSALFDDIELGTINADKIQNYNRYCAMHKFNEQFYCCKFLPQLIPDVIAPTTDTLRIIRKYGPKLIPKPDQIVKADFSILVRSPGDKTSSSDSFSHELYEELKRVDSMAGVEFETYCVSLLKALGYTSVRKTQKSWDYGADIIVSHQGEKYVVQCKRHSHLIDIGAVEETCRAREYYNATEGFVMTNQWFTERAIQRAHKEEIGLWDRGILMVLITLVLSGEVSKNKNKKKKSR